MIFVNLSDHRPPPLPNTVYQIEVTILGGETFQKLNQGNKAIQTQGTHTVSSTKRSFGELRPKTMSKTTSIQLKKKLDKSPENGLHGTKNRQVKDKFWAKKKPKKDFSQLTYAKRP